MLPVICWTLIFHNPPEVRQHFLRHDKKELAMSVITFGELRHGAEKSQSREKSVAVLNQLTTAIRVLELPVDAGVRYGEIRSALEKKGNIISNNDLWRSSPCSFLKSDFGHQ